MDGPPPSFRTSFLRLRPLLFPPPHTRGDAGRTTTTCIIYLPQAPQGEPKVNAHLKKKHVYLQLFFAFFSSSIFPSFLPEGCFFLLLHLSSLLFSLSPKLFKNDFLPSFHLPLLLPFLTSFLPRCLPASDFLLILSS